jgi:hypothetical protein
MTIMCGLDSTGSIFCSVMGFCGHGNDIRCFKGPGIS